jgi:hypothetical protein
LYQTGHVSVLELSELQKGLALQNPDLTAAVATFRSGGAGGDVRRLVEAGLSRQQGASSPTLPAQPPEMLLRDILLSNLPENVRRTVEAEAARGGSGGGGGAPAAPAAPPPPPSVAAAAPPPAAATAGAAQPSATTGANLVHKRPRGASSAFLGGRSGHSFDLNDPMTLHTLGMSPHITGMHSGPAPGFYHPRTGSVGFSSFTLGPGVALSGTGGGSGGAGRVQPGRDRVPSMSFEMPTHGGGGGGGGGGAPAFPSFAIQGSQSSTGARGHALSVGWLGVGLGDGGSGGGGGGGGAGGVLGSGGSREGGDARGGAGAEGRAALGGLGRFGSEASEGGGGALRARLSTGGGSPEYGAIVAAAAVSGGGGGGGSGGGGDREGKGTGGDEREEEEVVAMDGEESPVAEGARGVGGGGGDVEEGGGDGGGEEGGNVIEGEAPTNDLDFPSLLCGGSVLRVGFRWVGGGEQLPASTASALPASLLARWGLQHNNTAAEELRAREAFMEEGAEEAAAAAAAAPRGAGRRGWEPAPSRGGGGGRAARAAPAFRVHAPAPVWGSHIGRAGGATGDGARRSAGIAAIVFAAAVAGGGEGMEEEEDAEFSGGEEEGESGVALSKRDGMRARRPAAGGGGGGGGSAAAQSNFQAFDYDGSGPTVLETMRVGDVELPVVPRCEGWIGAYAADVRQRRIDRFIEKRRGRVWEKVVKYDVRKSFADQRLRVKGRFVKKEDEVRVGASPLQPFFSRSPTSPPPTPPRTKPLSSQHILRDFLQLF